MRELTSHIGSDLNGYISVRALDDPDPSAGGGCFWYQLSFYFDQQGGFEDIHFQHGPFKEVGINGTSDEAVLTVLLDRLTLFQQGAFACSENEEALTHLRAALSALKARTVDRQKRGVEGTNLP